jgi:hypothetical protein
VKGYQPVPDDDAFFFFKNINAFHVLSNQQRKNVPPHQWLPGRPGWGGGEFGGTFFFFFYQSVTVRVKLPHSRHNVARPGRTRAGALTVRTVNHDPDVEVLQSRWVGTSGPGGGPVFLFLNTLGTDANQ